MKASGEDEMRKGNQIAQILLCTLLLSLFAGSAFAAEFTERQLAYMPATMQIELFKRGEITPVDVLKAQKAEYDRTEEKVNGVTVAYWTIP